MAKSPGQMLPATQLISLPNNTAALQVRRARLKVTKGPDRGQQRDIGPHGVVVGTTPECDLVLTDTAVSRRQFEIVPAPQGFLLRDLHSKNGTLVGRMLVREAILTDAEEIRVGASRLRLQLLDGHDAYPLSSQTTFGPMLGRSVPMRQIFSLLERAAQLDVTVLLEGESGTGKDLAAEALHGASPRHPRPFVVVDCGAMQSTLVESELFGHARGAFTGADKSRAGAVETAQGGTVFLDEIGELDPALQPKLLRLLENREVKRLGESLYRPVDVRLVAATNRDLSAEVAAGRFREDLFFRLSVLRVRIPALRERRDDVGPLARTFVQKLRPDLDPVEVISADVLAMLRTYDWPGNVRELRNVVERLLLFPERPETAIGQLQEDTDKREEDLLQRPFHEARQVLTDRFEREYLANMLDAHHGVIAQAAKAAGIPRQTFHRLMTKHRLVRS